MSNLRLRPANTGERVIVKFRGEVQFEGTVMNYNEPYKTAVRLDDGKQVVVETADQKWTLEQVQKEEEAA
jgi:hypothetical protein